jgi:formylglycine-generating enzyme required for sulfatase activity
LSRFLQNLFKLSPPPEPETPDESPVLLPPSVRLRQSAKPPQPKKRPLRQRWYWLLVVVVLVAVLLIWRSEVGNHAWVTTTVERYQESWLPELRGTLERYHLTALAIPIGLVILVLAATLRVLLRGLGRLWRWFIAQWLLSRAILVALITLGVYFIANVNTWTVGVVEVGMDNLEADDVAVQFRGSLNAIGTEPLDRLALSSPGAPKKVKEARASLEHLSLADCPEILLGPEAPEYEGQPISLKRPQSGDLPDSGGQTITFNTALGSVNFPLEGFFRSAVRFSPGYREFGIRVIPAGQADELALDGDGADPTSPSGAEVIRVIVNDNKGGSWTVVGPRQDLPQLVDFLVVRMTLDVLVQRADISNARLALTLGNQAFDSRDFDSALAYYHLAESFNRKDPVIQTALGVTHFQLAALAPDGEEKELSLRRARHALGRAQFQPTSPSTSLTYLACVQSQLAEYQERAPETLSQFNETLMPDNPEAIRERREQLEPVANPARGPGRDISLLIHRAEAEGPPTFDLYYFTDSTLHFGVSLTGTQAVTDTRILSDTLSAPPRQVFAIQDGVYYVTRDGLVNFHQTGQPSAETDKRIIKDSDLQFTLTSTSTDKIYTGGIRQIFSQPPYLFAVGRFGQILRYYLEEPVDTTQDQISPESFIQADEADARQIFLDGGILYLLKNDGSIWRIPDALGTNPLELERQLIADADIQEIAVSGGDIYMLRRDGTIWRYQDRGDAEENRSVPLDQGANTKRIFAAPQGLFSLKNSGEVFFIPADPAEYEQNPLRKLELPAVGRNAIAAVGNTLLALEATPAGPLAIRGHDVSQTVSLLTAQEGGDPTATAVAIATAAAEAAAQSTQIVVAQASAVAGTIQANAAIATAEASAAQTPTPTSLALLPTPSAAATQTPAPLVTESPPPAGPPPTATAIPSPTLSPTPNASPTPLRSLHTRERDRAEEVLVRRDEDASRRFWIDSTEVTNRQYRLCVEKGACPENKQYSGLFTRDDHPVVGVNYQQAQAYCAWVGGALPTARQWREVATPGGARYPWGDNPPLPNCDVAVINDRCDDGEPGTRPVKGKPAGARTFEEPEAKVYDLIGNVWELTQDPGAGKDDIRVVLGGSWSNPDGTLLGGWKAFEPFNEIAQGEQHQERNLGFRCVRPFEVEESVATQQF